MSRKYPPYTITAPPKAWTIHTRLDGCFHVVYDSTIQISQDTKSQHSFLVKLVSFPQNFQYLALKS